jgi:ribonuclease D
MQARDASPLKRSLLSEQGQTDERTTSRLAVEKTGFAAKKRVRASRSPVPAPSGVNSSSFSTIFELPVSSTGLYASQNLHITYTNNSKVVDEFLLRHEASEHFGFDLEHRPTFKPGQKPNVSIIQLAPWSTGEIHPVLVYSLFHNSGTIPDSLKSLLHSDQIKKYGVGIKGDLANLKFMKFTQSTFTSFIDLSPLAHRAKVVDRSGAGLKALIAATMGAEVCAYKTKSMTMTNWELLSLGAAQVRYAALDAFCGVEIWRILQLKLADEIAEKEKRHNMHVPRITDGK